MTDLSKEFEEWLANRPPSVQALGRQFPIGSRIADFTGVVAHVIGYTESNEVIMSTVDPFTNYDAAVSQRFYVDAGVLRKSIADYAKYAKECAGARAH